MVAAKQIATLDALSGGRVILGVGVGWLSEEFEALGVPFKDRGHRHDDYLHAMKALWTQEKAAISNRFVDFRDAISRPRPAASVPIVVSGHSSAAARRVAPGDSLAARPCATSCPSTPSCDWWRLFAVRLGSGWAAAVDRCSGCAAG